MGAIERRRKKRTAITRLIIAMRYALADGTRRDGFQVDQGNASRAVVTRKDGMANRLPFPSAIHINTFVFRSVHHHSKLPSLPLLFVSPFLFSGLSHLLRMIVTLFAAGLLLVPSVNAFWRLPCSKPVVNARIDPIISPNVPSGHSHTIMGSNGAPHHKASLKVNLISRYSYRL